MQELFSAFGVSWSLLIAQAVNFGIVLIALWYFLYKPVMTTLAKRQALVAESVREAKHIEELFAKADTEAEHRVQVADATAVQIVASAHDLASSEKTRLLKDAESRAASIAKDAEAKASETLLRAQHESERDIARLAVLAAEKILHEHA